MTSPERGDGPPRFRPRAVIVALALLGLGLALQLHFLAHYPQPALFGDPAGYLKVGRHFLVALASVREGGSLSAAFESVRGYFYLLGAGGLFAALEGALPTDFAAWRRLMAVANVLAMAAAYLLGRRLARSEAGGLLALALAATYAPFSVETGRLYPDPVTGALFAFAAWATLKAVDGASFRWALAGGLLLTAAAVVRTQIAPYLLLVGGLTLALTSLAWRRRPARRVAAGFALGLAPLVVVFGVVTWAVGDRDDVVQLGNVTFRTPYPMGYWMFLDSGGWPGVYRLRAEPYYAALGSAAETDPDLLASRPKQLLFTARYLASRPREAILQPLENAYRLYERPANDYKWDYPIPYAHQVRVQRALAVLALAMAALLAAEAPGRLAPFAVPFALLPLHALVFSWPRYNLPAMPIVIAAAGAFLARALTAARRDPGPRRWSGLLVRLALGCVALLALAAAVFDRMPDLARGLREAGTLLLCALPFVAVARLAASGAARRRAAVAFALVVVLRAAHLARDPAWHEAPLRLGGEVRGVEQVIMLEAPAVAALRAAEQVAVALDLRVPAGHLRNARLEVAGRVLPIEALAPSMPRLPESTSTGGRDWRPYPQWWVVLLPPEVRPQAAGAFHVRFTAPPDAQVVLGADRFRAQQRVYEGPSLGDWPRYVPLKLEVDGDYRLPVRWPLASAGTQTYALDHYGNAKPLRRMARVRLLALSNTVAGTRFRSAAVPPTPGAALGFFAYSGGDLAATLWVDGAPAVELTLDAARDAVFEGPRFRLCQRASGERAQTPYAALVLRGPGSGSARSLEVRFNTAFARQPAFFVVDRRRTLAELEPFFTACGVPPGEPRAAGAIEVEDASRNTYPADTGHWRAAALY